MIFKLQNNNPSIPLTLRVDLSLSMCSNNEIVEINREVKRNDPCICGSGKKFKKCCMDMFIKRYRERIK
jgi:hypothetical protein